MGCLPRRRWRARAPLMTIDGEVHSNMTPEAALALPEDIRKKEDAAV